MNKQQIVFKKCEHVNKDAPEWALCEDCYYASKDDDTCYECGKPYNSEYHISDQCINVNEDKDEN